jgi:viroplasmin and RNaseH domain-containing protein
MRKVSRFPGAVHKRFSSLEEAEKWVGVEGCLQLTQANTLASGESHSSFFTQYTFLVITDTFPLDF